MTSKADYGCSAVVTLTIEVKSQGSWGANATVTEVMEIGGRETLNAIRNALVDSRLGAKIVGEPKIGAITWKRTDQ